MIYTKYFWLTNRIIKHDAGPVAWRKLRLSDVRDLTRLSAAHPHSLADYEAVCIFRQNDTVVCNVNVHAITMNLVI